MSVSHRLTVRGLLHAVGTALRKVPGSLVLLPLAVLAVGTEYRIQSPESLRAGWVGGLPADRSAATAGFQVRLHFEPEGAELTTGVPIDAGRHLLVTLPRATTAFTLEVQAECCRTFDVFGITPEDRASLLWSIPAVEGLAGLRSRATEITAAAPVAMLRIVPGDDHERHIISGIRVTRETRISHAVIPGIAWGLLLLVGGIGQFAPRLGERLLGAWSRADLAITVVILTTLVFRLTPAIIATGGVVAGAALVITASRRAFREWPPAALLLNGTLIVLATWLAPKMIARLVEQRVAYEYDETIDHRLRPNGADINPDAIRFRGTAASIEADDFNIVFLGDSFTYGWKLDYADTVPSQVERALAARRCEQRVRAINFGWISSSPLLALRLLRDIGHKYHPDLIVYLLDMTDFYDDLNYEQRFQALQGTQVLPSAVTSALVERAARLVFDRDALEQVKGSLRTASPRGLSPIPTSRFFVTNQPLERSVNDIERGVMENLRQIHGYATTELRAAMVLVVVPRAYQHSDRESPYNWEAGEYDVLGPHVLAPFQYFERRRDALPYRVFSLLPTFQQAAEFPLYLRDDPHWTPAGARLAAQGITEYLVAAGTVPCAD